MGRSVGTAGSGICASVPGRKAPSPQRTQSSTALAATTDLPGVGGGSQKDTLALATKRSS